MRQRSELILKVVCLVALAVCVYQLTRMASHRVSLANVRIPELPTITNAPSDPKLSSKGPPNAARSPLMASKGTNAPATNTAAIQKENTNAAPGGTGALAVARSSTNTPATAKPASNVVATASATNTSKTATNLSGSSTTSPPVVASARPGPPPGMGRPGMTVDLPKEVRVKLDRVVDSEILGPVMRPMPMALLGIAGESVFIRAPNGQTGVIKEGDTLGGVKLLKVGINRVLVEEEGESKELMIFSGYGGQSLVSNVKTNT